MGADLLLTTVEIRETEPECQARLARMTFTEADMTRLRAAGYTDAFTSLEDGVKDYIQTYLNQDDRYF